jgi:hypothetical protein
MGREPLPVGEAVTDPPNADATLTLTNRVALVVGANGPFYPFYLWWLLPGVGWAALLTLPATPLFLAVPWLARRSPAASQVLLVATGLANTVWCTGLLGADSGVGLFVLPCIVLAGFASRFRLLLLGVGLLAQQVVLHWPWPGLVTAGGATLWVLNATSVGMLLAFIALMTSHRGTAANSGGGPAWAWLRGVCRRWTSASRAVSETHE